MYKRPLIGLLTNDLVGAYQYSFWSGMNAAARAENCDLVSFNGGELGAPVANKAMRRSVFELVHMVKPDALVVMSPVFANFNDQSEIDAFLESMAPIPVVTVAIARPGHPAVLVDSARGIDRLVDHLAGDHGRSRFAYVGGPVLNPEARERKEAFLKGLKRYGLEFNQRLDLVGDFDFGLARDSVARVLEAGIPFDALVAANDNMALGAMEALKFRGRKIPDDVIVAGFDDVEDGLYSNPALTTVRQPVFEQGEMSLRLALDLIDGIQVPAVSLQSASLICRGSCGCRSASLNAARDGLLVSKPAGGTAKSMGSPAHREAVREACDPHNDGARLSDALEEMLAAMCRDASQGGVDSSLGAFIVLMETASRQDDDLDRWQVFLSKFRAASLPYLPAELAVVAAFDGLLHQMRVVVHERTAQSSAYKSLEMQRWSRKLNELGCRLIDSFDMSRLVASIAQGLKELQISSFHLMLREASLEPGEMRQYLSVDNGVRMDLPETGAVTTIEDLFRRIVRKSPVRRALLIEPLFFGQTQLGYVMLELSVRRGMLLDSLSGQISASIMGARFQQASSCGPVSTTDVDKLIGW